MANRGQDYGQDFSFTPGASALTVTSLYRVGYLSAAHTISVVSTAANALKALGIIQTDQLSAGSHNLSLRMQGVSAALCAGTCSAGDLVSTDATGGITATTLAGLSLTVLTAGLLYRGVVGRALEDGISAQVIEIMVNPQLAFGIE